MNILIFGRGHRANALVELYLQDGTNHVTWVLAAEQGEDGLDELFEDYLGDNLEFWELPIANVKLRKSTQFDIAHVIVTPMHSPASGSPFNQPHINAILELIEMAQVTNDRKITTINSSLMGIGGNARALFGFHYLNYVYMPFLPIDYRDNYTATAYEAKCYPIFPTHPPHAMPIAYYGDPEDVKIPHLLYSVQLDKYDGMYLERMAYHAFSAQLIMSQIASEMMLLETLADNREEGKPLIASVANVTGFDLEYRPWVVHNQSYLGSIGIEQYSKPGYILMAAATAQANGVSVTQARIVLDAFNNSDAKHICVDGHGAYYLNSGCDAAFELAGILAAEIGHDNVYVIDTRNDEHELPKHWNHEDVFNVMVAGPTGFAMPETLLSGHTEFDIIV